ncbi:MAG: YccF domain-containing protein [Corynebacterium casei]|nr:YccF domain-containing protein [Corynebacterium casei]
MKTILNIIWFICGGFLLAARYFLAGIIACLLVVTIPAGVASFRMANYALWPFGRSVVQPTKGAGSFSAVGNFIWFIVAGLWLAIGHVVTAAGQAVTIIGIPLAIANIKMIPVTCFPFGRSIVPSDRIPFGYEPMVKL